MRDGSVSASALAAALAIALATSRAAMTALPVHPLLGAYLRAVLSGGVAVPQALVQPQFIAVGFAVVRAVLQTRLELIHHAIAVGDAVRADAVHQLFAKAVHIAIPVAALGGGRRGRGQGEADGQEGQDGHRSPSGKSDFHHFSRNAPLASVYGSAFRPAGGSYGLKLSPFDVDTFMGWNYEP